MYVLVVRDPEGNETEYDLVGEAVLGRDASADVQMPDPGVSRQHARLFLEDGLCYVEDLGSANGTLLDGEPVVGEVVLEPGRAVALGPFEVWVEASDEAGADEDVEGDYEDDLGGVDASTGRYSAPAASRGRKMLGTLEGISGGALGQIFEVRDGSTIGRLPGVDIVVDDPSISRKHAEVHFVDGGVVVSDLDSANGTFVNEAPIIEQTLADGDLVTFGSVAFNFSLSAGLESLVPAAGGSAMVAGRRGSRGSKGGGGKGVAGKRKILFAVAGVFLVGMLALAVVGGGDDSDPGSAPAGQKKTKSGQSEDLRREVFTLMRRGKMMMDSEQWEQAEDVFAKAVELDPINSDARNNLNQVRLEGEMRDVFNQGNRLYQQGELEGALETYMSIDPDSMYLRRARFQAHQIINRLQSRYDGECRGHVRANRFSQALRPCRRYMDLACQCPETINEDAKKALRRAERIERVPASERWSCPTGFEEWMPCRRTVGEDPAAEQIKQKYAHEGIREAVLTYHSGRVDDARRQLNRLEDGRDVDSAVKEKATRLRRQMVFVQGKYGQGQTEVLRGEIERAHSEWEELLEADREIMPEGLRSQTASDAVRRLSGAYHDRAFQLHRSRRFPEAYSWYRKGYEVNPDDTRIGEGIRRLERVAQRQMRSARTCGELRQILRYTVDDPPSAVHRQVEQLLKDRGC